MISQVFPFKLLQIYITSVSEWLHFRYKTCQIVLDVSMIRQFHEFSKSKFWRVFAIWNHCASALAYTQAAYTNSRIGTVQPLDRRTASWSTPRGSLKRKKKADWAAQPLVCLLEKLVKKALCFGRNGLHSLSQKQQQSSLESESPGDIVHLGVRARRSRRRDTIKKSSKNSVFFTTKKSTTLA